MKTEANYGTVLGTLIVYRMLPWQPFWTKGSKSHCHGNVFYIDIVVYYGNPENLGSKSIASIIYNLPWRIIDGTIMNALLCIEYVAMATKRKTGFKRWLPW